MRRWSDKQIAMLREMGVQHFWPMPTEAAAATATTAEVAQPPQATAPAPQPHPITHEPAPPRASTQAPATPPSPLPMPARAVDIDTMDWPALQSTVAQCQACGLCRSRKQAVFGVGHPQARWMLVGEAPGEQEDRLGEPFVGRSGQLLDRMLGTIGLTRSEAPSAQQVYIANVIKCRPPGNRNPLPDEVAQCEPFLLRQVQLVQPKLIVAMGRFAVQSLLQSSEPIGRLRGRIHHYHGVPLVVTYHPAYLLRNPADKALAWDDLCLAREIASA